MSTLGSYCLYIGIILPATWMLNNAYKRKMNDYGWKSIAFISFTLVFLLSALRYYSTNDVEGYCHYLFNQVRDTWDATLISMQRLDIEPGFAFVYQISKNLTDEPYLMIVLSSLIMCGMFYLFIVQNKDGINWGDTLFLLFCLSFMGMYSGIRQGVAVSIVVYAIKYVREQKLFRFSLFVFLASLFHSSAIFAIVFYMFGMKFFKYKTKLFIVVISILVLIVLGSKITYGEFDSRARETIGGFSISLILEIIVLYFASKWKAELKNDFDGIDIYILILIFGIGISFVDMFFAIGRFRWYTTMSVCILIPIILKKLQEKRIMDYMISRILLYSYCLTYLFLQMRSWGCHSYEFWPFM